MHHIALEEEILAYWEESHPVVYRLQEAAFNQDLCWRQLYALQIVQASQAAITLCFSTPELIRYISCKCPSLSACHTKITIMRYSWYKAVVAGPCHKKGHAVIFLVSWLHSFAYLLLKSTVFILYRAVAACPDFVSDGCLHWSRLSDLPEKQATPSFAEAWLPPSGEAKPGQSSSSAALLVMAPCILLSHCCMCESSPQAGSVLSSTDIRASLSQSCHQITSFIAPQT